MPHELEPFFLAAMDPGKTTGLSLMDIQPESYTLVDYKTVVYDPEMMSSPLMVLKEWKEIHGTQPHVLVYENFHVRPGRKVPDTTALNIIGGLEHWLMDFTPYTQVIAREPVEGKHLVTDEVLKSAGLYTADDADSRHVRDANRHAVAYLQTIRHTPLCNAAWPRRSVQSGHDHA